MFIKLVECHCPKSPCVLGNKHMKTTAESGYYFKLMVRYRVSYSTAMPPLIQLYSWSPLSSAESLPETVGALTKLDTLLMSYNRIRALPATLGGLKHLKTVNLGWVLPSSLVLQ